MAGKKVTLPFVVAPRLEPIMHQCGSDESGKIEIMRRGYLTVAEKSFMQQASTGNETMIKLHSLASKVASANGMQTSEVIETLGKGSFDASLFADYEDELTEILSEMATLEERNKIAAAACLLIFRVDQDFGIEEVMELHPDIVADLYLLYLMEDQKSLEGFEKLSETETEGKD